MDKDGKALCVVTHYSDNDQTEEKTVKLDFGREGRFEIYLLDKDHNGELVKITDNLTFTMTPCSCILIKEK